MPLRKQRHFYFDTFSNFRIGSKITYNIYTCSFVPLIALKILTIATAMSAFFALLANKTTASNLNILLLIQSIISAF